MNAIASINPFYAARIDRVAAPRPEPQASRTFYAKLPRAPITGTAYLSGITATIPPFGMIEP